LPALLPPAPGRAITPAKALLAKKQQPPVPAPGQPPHTTYGRSSASLVEKTSPAGSKGKGSPRDSLAPDFLV
jgi:hypothetical protein